jgi:hypothetical protein
MHLRSVAELLAQKTMLDARQAKFASQAPKRTHKRGKHRAKLAGSQTPR